MHLLNWHQQPERRGVSWESTAAEQRYPIAGLPRENPSLRPRPPELPARVYPAARLATSAATEMSPAIFPEARPFALDDMPADGWLP